MPVRLFDTFEWKMLSVGIFLTIILLGLAVFFYTSETETVQASAIIFAAHAFGGRAAGIGLSIMNNFSYLWTIIYNFYLEILIVCFTYSISILSINNYLKFRVLKYYSRRLERKAKKHKDKLEKYGGLGLFFFVMAPLPVTGPVVGTIAGKLLKFSPLKNFSASFLGTLAATILWTFFFNFLEQNLHIIQYLIIAIFIVVLVSNTRELKNNLFKK